MNVKNLKTGNSKTVRLQNVKFSELVRSTWLEKISMNPSRRRMSPEDIHARLILAIGLSLAIVFVITTVGITYALIFVTQPIANQAPNDAAFIDVLKMSDIGATLFLGATTRLPREQKCTQTQVIG